jgi:hypothetical protein
MACCIINNRSLTNPLASSKMVPSSLQPWIAASRQRKVKGQKTVSGV